MIRAELESEFNSDYSSKTAKVESVVEFGFI